MNEFSQSLGLTSDVITQITTELDKTYVPVTKLTEIKEANATLTNQLKERDKQLSELEPKAADDSALSAQIKQLLEQNKQAAVDYEAKLAEMSLTHAVDNALAAVKVKNSKAVRALLDADLIKMSADGAVIGLDEQLTKIKGTDPYLFDKQPQKTHTSNNSRKVKKHEKICHTKTKRNDRNS